MRGLIGLAVGAAIAASAGSAGAASIDIRNAAVRVVVIPEARSDVSVTTIKTNPELRLRVRKGLDGRVIVDGGGRWIWLLGLQGMDCYTGDNGPRVHVWGVGHFAYDELPQILVRTPLEARVGAGGAVFGAISASNQLDLWTGGCGEMTVGNVRDRLSVRDSGAAQVRTGSAGSMALDASGSGHITTRAAANGLDADVSGSGVIEVAEASGPVHADVSGSGRVRVDAGRASTVNADVSGSGTVDFMGAADSFAGDISGSGRINAGSAAKNLTADISGAGMMRADQVSGAVRAQISGSGALRIDGGHATNVDAHLSGAGGVDFEGVADSLNAEASGSGSIRVGRVIGAVVSSTTGSGRVIVDGH